MKQKVLIVGSIGLDDVKTPYGDEKGVPGGSAVYGSIAASASAGVDMVGVAGEDFPREIIGRLNARGIDTAGLEIVPGGKTFRWGGEYVGDMDEARTLFTDLNVLMDFNPTIPDSCRDDAVVFLANIDPSLQLSVLDQVRKPMLVMCDTMNFWIESRTEDVLAVLRRVDIALLNSGEARLLFNTNSLPAAGAELLKLGVKYAIIKKGEHGVLMFSEEGFFSTPAMPLESVVDPTGAGDSFAGGFSGYLARVGKTDETTLRQAVVAGSATASFAVEGFSIRALEALTPEMLAGRCSRLLGAMRVPELDLL